MKKILGAIGGFFKKIWRWIADTAWIQPLLIVGLIFGVIFSIPSISSAIRNASAHSGSFEFFKSNRVKAGDFLKYYEEGADSLDAKYGDKNTVSSFLLVFVEEDCENCKAAEKAFKEFVTSSSYVDATHLRANVKFMFKWTDDNDLDDDKDVDSYLELSAALIDDIDYIYEETYKMNQGEKDITYNEQIKTESFEKGEIATPCMALFQEGEIKSVWFSVQGSTKTEKADFIRNFYFQEHNFDGDPRTE